MNYFLAGFVFFLLASVTSLATSSNLGAMLWRATSIHGPVALMSAIDCFRIETNIPFDQPAPFIIFEYFGGNQIRKGLVKSKQRLVNVVNNNGTMDIVIGSELLEDFETHPSLGVLPNIYVWVTKEPFNHCVFDQFLILGLGTSVGSLS